MNVRRRRPLTEPAASAAMALCRAERAVALLDCVRPLGLDAELSRLSAAFQRGQRLTPVFRYAERVSLGPLRRELEALARNVDSGDVELGLIAERASELAVEAELAENVGSPRLGTLAPRRFPLPPDAERVEGCARQLLSASTPVFEPGTRCHVSDDSADPRSLWSEISRRLSRERFPVRIEVVPGLVSLAAVAEGAVRVRAGARLTERVSRRIALHEVEGHVRPRVLGKALGGVFWCGSAGASEDEEGRAIWLEQRAGLLDAERLGELARRYVAAASVRRGADFWETADLVARTGATPAASVELSCRVHRGGGLARELVYLTGYLRVAGGLAARPELSRVQECGRVSLAAAARLLGGSVELDDDGDVV